jgi:hypothetical protein
MEALLAAAWLLPNTTTNSNSNNELLAQTHLPKEEDNLPDIPESDVTDNMEVNKKTKNNFNINNSDDFLRRRKVGKI